MGSNYLKKFLTRLCLFFGVAILLVACLFDSKSEAASPEGSDSQVGTDQNAEETDEYTGMVYATGEEYEKVCAAIRYAFSGDESYFGQYGLSVVEESITPMYYIDLKQLRKEKKLVLQPSYFPMRGDGARVYMVKLVDKQGFYGGRAIMNLKDGQAYLSSGSFWAGNETEDTMIEASPNYADYAERIREILGEEKVISPRDVRCVSLYYEGLWLPGTFFYIHNKDYQVLIPTGGVKRHQERDTEDIRHIIDMDGLWKIVDQCVEREQEYLNYKSQWEKEHPGDTFYPPAGGMVNIEAVGLSGGANNVNDIASYLNIDYTKNCDSNVALDADLKPYKKGNTDNTDNTDNTVLLIILISVGVALASGAVAFVIVYRRRKRMH